jgi:mercuric reductase
LDRFDLLILGSGSTAFAAALRAKELGKTAVMTEERTVGGICVNRGCLPSKNLIEAARLLHDARNPRYPGLSPTRPELDFRKLVVQKDELTRSYREKRYENLVDGSIHIERGHVQFVDPHTVEVGGKKLAGEAILIATGSRPVVPDVDGLADVPYLTSDLLTSDEALELFELPASLLILGGGYIALELGQMFHRFGSEVTILERSEEILSRGYEPEVGPTIRRILEEEGMRIVTSATVHSVRREASGVSAVETDKGSKEHRAARLLVAAGRRPNSDRIALEKSGVSVGRRG